MVQSNNDDPRDEFLGGEIQRQEIEVRRMSKESICYCLAGPGGEDLEGGYYDAGDNLKVHIIFYVW